MRANSAAHYTPAVTAILYLAIFAGVLGKKLLWPVGDVTDVIVPGLFALPWSLLLFWEIVGVGRDGAFVFVAFGGLLNTCLIFLVVRTLVRARAHSIETGLGLRGGDGNTS